MLATLVFGYLQLIMFAILFFGVIWWAVCKIMGWPVSFTPASLWEDQQQLIDQDPDVETNKRNLAILQNLQSLNYENYRRENYADRLYGFQNGDPNYWRQLDQQQINGDTELPENVPTPQCAICMDYFKPEDQVSPMPCHSNHLFHTQCVKPWLEKNRNCPLCKYTVQSPRELSSTQELILNSSILSRSNSFGSYVDVQNRTSQRKPSSRYE